MVYPIIGRRKRGKTTLGYYMVRKSAKRMIFDPRRIVPNEPGMMRCFQWRDFIDQAVPALEDGELTQVVYSPESDDLNVPFGSFCGAMKQWVRDHPVEPCGVLIDELGWIDSGSRNPRALHRALRDCEPDLFHVYITCHRPSDVPTATRSIADTWCLFHCVQEHDLNVIRERCNESVAAAVQTLEARAFIRYDDETATHKLYSDAASWYVPTRTPIERALAASGDAFDGLNGQNLTAKKTLTARLPLD